MKEEFQEVEEWTFSMFRECLGNVNKRGKTWRELSKQYEKRTGISYKSPIAMMYAAFVEGILKGIELEKNNHGNKKE